MTPLDPRDVARIDHDRARRCGFPEVVLCAGKTALDAGSIAAEIAVRSGRVLCTRAEPAHAEAIAAALPGAVHHPRARCVTYERERSARRGLVAVLAAGTADLPVAEEAAITADMLGCAVERHYDVGVAGLHRLLEVVPEVRRAGVAIAVAGMEGALPSVVAGLLDLPVIAVPTSTGYGVGQGGLVALAAMLSSCAAGVLCVNIDNGFGAGYAAAMMLRRSGPVEA